MPRVEQGELPAAIAAIDEGIEAIEQFLEQHDQQERADTLGELQFLRRWRSDLLEREDGESEPTPTGEEDSLERLQRLLDEAVASERYEDAARLRDQIRRLTDPPPPSGIAERLS